MCFEGILEATDSNKLMVCRTACCVLRRSSMHMVLWCCSTAAKSERVKPVGDEDGYNAQDTAVDNPCALSRPLSSSKTIG